MSHAAAKDRSRTIQLSLAVTFMIGGALLSPALGQSVQPRRIATTSPRLPGDALWETAIAAGQARVIALSHVTGRGRAEIGYAVAQQAGGSWSWVEAGRVPQDPNLGDVFDPTVAAWRTGDRFLACALGQSSGNDRADRIIVARYDAAAGGFESWRTIYRPRADLGDRLVDKPWVVAGRSVARVGNAPSAGSSALRQEFYFAAVVQNLGLPGVVLRLVYGRSVDDGQTWVTGDVLLDPNDPGTMVPGFWPIPRVWRNRPLYVAYVDNRSGQRRIRILVGTDIDSGPHAGAVRFAHLTDALNPGVPLEIVLNRAIFEIPARLPGATTLYKPSVGYGVDMAVDPSDPDRLVLVFPDTATADPNDTDLDVYAVVLERVSGNIWQIVRRVSVIGDSPTRFESDQFMPAVDIDSDGRIHVIFYDDRNYTDPPNPSDPNAVDLQPDGPSTPAPKFDVFYAYSPDAGQQWFNQELYAVPPEPAMDFSRGPLGTFQFGDYIGIDVGSDRVWTAYMGTAEADDPPNDPNHNPTVIWSSQVLLP